MRNLEVIVIDNGSTDRSSPAFPTRFARAQGPAQRGEPGFRRREQPGNRAPRRGELVLLLNDDTVLEPRCAGPARANRCVEHPRGAAAQAKLVRMDDPSVLDTAGSFLTATGFLVHRGSGEPEVEFDESDEIFAAKGAALLIRRDALRQVGVFDPDFFAYFEETDLCWRLWLAGWRVGFAAGRPSAAQARGDRAADCRRSSSSSTRSRTGSARWPRISARSGSPGCCRTTSPLCVALAAWYAVRGQAAAGRCDHACAGLERRAAAHDGVEAPHVQSLRRVGDRDLMPRIHAADTARHDASLRAPDRPSQKPGSAENRAGWSCGCAGRLRSARVRR